LAFNLDRDGEVGLVQNLAALANRSKYSGSGTYLKAAVD
jgi:hypothetical protein